MRGVRSLALVVFLAACTAPTDQAPGDPPVEPGKDMRIGQDNPTGISPPYRRCK